MYFDLGYDMEQTLYGIMVILGAVVLIIYNLLNIRNKKQFYSVISKRMISYTKNNDKKIPMENLTAIAELIIITLLYYASGGVANTILGNLLGMADNYYGMMYFSTLLLFAGCYVIGLDVIRVFDMIAPTYALGLIFAKTGCFFTGCCSGIAWENGLYNFDAKEYQVPIQLIEASWALLIFIILFSSRKKIKKGTGFPLYLMLYSSIRFVTEFLRSDPDVFMGLKIYHLCCISGVIVSAVLFIVAIKFSDKISLCFTENDHVALRIADRLEKAWISHDKRKLKKQKKPIVHHKKKKR